MLIFEEGGKTGGPEKNLGARIRTNKKLNPHDAKFGNRIWATLVGGNAHTNVPSLLPPRNPVPDVKTVG